MGRRRDQAHAAAANTPETAEQLGNVAGAPPPTVQTEFPPTEGVRTVTSDDKKAGATSPVPGYPADLALSGGYDHGQHTFVSQAVHNPEIQQPEQKTVCAVCGAEVVPA